MLFNLICIFFRLFFIFVSLSVFLLIVVFIYTLFRRINEKVEEKTHARTQYILPVFFSLVGCRIFSCFVYLKFRDLVTTFYKQHNTVLFSRFLFRYRLLLLIIVFLRLFGVCFLFLRLPVLSFFRYFLSFSIQFQKFMFVFRFVCRLAYVCESLRFLYVLYIFRTSSVKQNGIQCANVLWCECERYKKKRFSVCFGSKTARNLSLAKC